MAQFATGQDVEVRIDPSLKTQEITLDGQGMYLWVDSGQARVFLPATEYPLDPRLRNEMLQKLRERKCITVRIVEQDNATGTWIVSHSRAFSKSFKEEVKQWIPGETIKSMRVTNVHADLVYGVIPPGIVGRTSLSDIRPYLRQHHKMMEAIPLAGDHLVGYVEEPIEQEQEIIVPLDVVTYLEHLDKQEVETVPSSLSFVANDLHKNHRETIGLPFQTILVVDDDEQYRKAMQRLLQADGLVALLAADKYNAEAIASKQKEREDLERRGGIDVAIIDVNLDHLSSSAEGLQLAKSLRDLHPEIKVLLMSGDSELRKKFIEGENLGLQVHGFISKPFGAVRLREELAKVAVANPVPPSRFLASENNPDFSPPRVKQEEMHSVEHQVQECKEQLRAEKAVLFEMHPISLTTDAIAGDKSVESWEGKKWGFWRHKLRQSPVRDVAIDSEVLFEKDATDASRFLRHRWLRRAYDYRSCIGLPVPATGEHRYCLFLLHSESNAFLQEDKAIAEMFAVKLAAILDKERLLRILEAETRYVTSGITLNILGHELRTMLGTAALDADSLLQLLDSKESSSPVLRQTLGELVGALERSTAICQMFVDLARNPQIVPVQLSQCVHRASYFAQPQLQELTAEIIEDIPETLWVRVDRVALEQALFNLFVNAAEQCHQFERYPGQIEVSARLSEVDPKQILIFVKDNGPGIHFCRWEDVFKPGFSTKKGGSGLGLHICKRTLANIGGKIEVSWSALWVGTTFVLTMPAATPPQKK